MLSFSFQMCFCSHTILTVFKLFSLFTALVSCCKIGCYCYWACFSSFVSDIRQDPLLLEGSPQCLDKTVVLPPRSSSGMFKCCGMFLQSSTSVEWLRRKVVSICGRQMYAEPSSLLSWTFRQLQCDQFFFAVWTVDLKSMNGWLSKLQCTPPPDMKYV